MPSSPVRMVTSGGRPVRVVTSGPADPVRIVTSGPSDPVRVITQGISDPVRVISGLGLLYSPLLELEADTGVISTGGFVDTWQDQSGNGFDFTATGTSRPAFTTVGGYPCLQFDFVDDWMLGQNWAALDNLDSFTIFAVKTNLWFAGIITKIYNDGCGAVGCTGWSFYDGGLMLYSNFTNFIGQTINWVAGTDTDKVIVSAEVVNRNELHSYLNGGLVDSIPNGGKTGNGAYNYSTSEPVRLGIDGMAGLCEIYGGFNPPNPNYLYALRIYSPAPSATIRAEIETELMTRYGV